MSEQINFQKDFIYRIHDLTQKEEVLSFLAGELFKNGYVKEGYEKAILEREKEYPTGLFTGEINVAIPHADCAYVKKGAMAVGILKNNVEFFAMDDPEKPIAVSLVIMLALQEPHGHLEMLQKVVKLIQNQEDLEKILQLEDSNDVYCVISDYLL